MIKFFLTIIASFTLFFAQAQDKEWVDKADATALAGTTDYRSYSIPETPNETVDAAFACGRPTNLVTSSITQTTAFLSWSPVSGAYGYVVEYQRAYVSATWVYAGFVSANSFSLTNLAPNELYYWRVRSYCNSGVSSYATSPFFFTQAAAACTAPTFTFVSPFSITASSATVGWDAQAAAVSYTVEYRPVGSATWLLGGTPVQNTLTLTGLAAATNYEFRVRSNCSNGSSAFLEPAQQFVTAATTCIPPVSVTVSNITTTSANVSWPAAPGAGSYIVDLKPTGTATWTFTQNITLLTPNTATFSSLTPGTMYDCRVRTVCNSGATSDGILTQFVTAAAACNAPTGLVSSETTEFGVLLNWSAVAGAESYTIEFKAATATTWITAASTLGTSLRLLNLTPATLYDWRVRSNCPGGAVSGYSAAQFTTAAATGGGGTCTAPTGLSSFNDCGYAEFSWLPVAGALSYRVEYKLTTSATWLVAASSTGGTSVGITGAAGNYNWRIQTNCASGTSAFANGTARILGGAACLQRQQQQRNSALLQVENETAPLKVMPQPARNELTVNYQAEANEMGQMDIISQVGTTVLRNSISLRKGSNMVKLNVGKLLPGAYVLQVKTKGKTETTKVIIQ